MNRNVQTLIDELKAVCRQAYETGLQRDTGGNVSARIEESKTMVVKASGCSLAHMEAENFVITDFEGQKISGSGKATREALLHGYIYKEFPGAKAVVHVHSPYATAISVLYSEIPPATHQAKLKFPGRVNVISIATPIVEKADLDFIRSCLDDKGCVSGAFVLENHGVVAFSDCPFNALYLAEFIEETAKIIYLRQTIEKRIV